MQLGLDLGSSGVKSVLLDAVGAVVGQATVPLSLSHPHPRWSEQDPSDRWQAAREAVALLRQQHDVACF